MSAYDSTALVIGDTPQLFLDNLLVEASHDLTKTWHSPRKDDANPLIVKDKPWEHVPYFQSANHVVLRDSQDGLFKCWYEDMIDHFGREGEYMVAARQCYAFSEDGLTWHKPELDVVEEDGHKTNIVLGGTPGMKHVHSAGVIEDPHPADPSMRFRALFTHYPPYQGHIRLAGSSDGIHWNMIDQLASFGDVGSSMGDACLLHYDRHSRSFVAICRHFYQTHPSLNPRHPIGPTNPGPRYPHDFSRQNRRRIWIAHSHDMIHWSKPELILSPDDEQDNIDEGYYGMTFAEVGGFDVGLLAAFHRAANNIDVRLVFSRDGHRWSHANNRQTWLPYGPPGNWDQHMAVTSSRIIDVGDEHWIYYGGAFCHHDYFIWGPREGMEHPEISNPELQRFGLGLARLRRHGFVSFDAGAVREGMLITRPVLSDGENLVINARCSAGGYIRAEIIDDGDNLAPGLNKEACDTFTGDSVAHTMTWKGNARVPAPKPEFGGDSLYPWKQQTPYRKVRFYMKNAQLFSFQFAAAST